MHDAGYWHLPKRAGRLVIPAVQSLWVLVRALCLVLARRR
jgi:hypothetical protein